MPLLKFVKEIEGHYQACPTRMDLIYAGLGGIAFMYWHMHKRMKNEEYLGRAIYWIHQGEAVQVHPITPHPF